MKTTKMYFGIILFLLSLGLRAQYVVDFEGAGETNGSYAAATVSLNAINWSIGPQALIGTAGSDIKNGDRAARIRRDGSVFGSISMIQDKPNGIGTISFLYSRSNFSGDRATTGDGPPSFVVEYSMDGGSTWTQAGSTISLDGVNSLTTFSAIVDESGNGRIRIVQTAGAAGRRWNVDDITITDFSPSGPTVDPPQSLITSLLSRTTIEFSATPNADNDPVLIATNNTNTFGTPVDGDPYSIGNPLPGGGTVYYVGPASSIPNHTGRYEGTEYFYQAWSIGTGDEYSNNFASASISTPVGVVAIPYAIDFSSNPFDNNTWIERDRLGAQSWTYNGSAEQLEMNGFASGCNDNDDWLIAPPFDLSSTNNVIIEAALSERFGGNDLIMLYSDDYDGFGDPNDFSWDVLDTIFSSAISATPVAHPVLNNDLQAISSSRVYVAFRYLSLASGSCAEWRIENFNAVLTTTPSLIAIGTPTPFSTVVGIPSAEQTIEVSGDDLQDDILVSAPAGYEVSLTSGSGFGSSVSIPFGSGTVAATDVFVRLSGATQGTFNGNIEVTSPQAISQTIALEGQVTPAPPAITATGAAGAYFENFQDFVSAATLPAGWALSGSVTTYIDDWGAGTAAGTRGNDTVLGYQHTGSSGVFTSTLSLLNSSGSTITALQVSYRGKVERATQGRSPEFDVKIDGVSYPALVYSTAGGVDEDVTAIISGLSIAENQTFEISWSSERGGGGGSSRQIGLSNVEVLIPQAATVTIEDLGNQILAGNVSPS